MPFGLPFALPSITLPSWAARGLGLPQPAPPPPPTPVVETTSLTVDTASAPPPAPTVAYGASTPMPTLPSAGLILSPSYTGLLSKLEGIKGMVPGKPGWFTWYFDNIGVPTLGYGHALHHPITGAILKRSELGAAVSDLANQAMMKYYGSLSISMDQVLALKAKDMQSYADDAALHIRVGTPQDQLEMLIDFAYNVGEHALETSTLLRLHNAGNTPIGPLDPATLARNSKAKVPIHTVADAFCAWSNSGGAWTLGVFHRRCCEVLIYNGMDYDAAYGVAFGFHG